MDNQIMVNYVLKKQRNQKYKRRYLQRHKKKTHDENDNDVLSKYISHKEYYKHHVVSANNTSLIEDIEDPLDITFYDK